MDVSVRMRPASGLARVELNPKDDSFLEGERVRLNYDRMRRTENLPKRKRGWPPIQELVTDPSDSNLIEQRVLVARLERSSVNDQQYFNILDQVVGRILKGMTFITYAHEQFYARNIDQDGTACTEEGKNIIQGLINKLEVDFHKVGSQNFADKMASRITWLYTSTPQNIIDYLRNNFTHQLAPGRFNRFVEASGRAFNQPNDFKLLFRTIALNTDERRRLAIGQQNNALPFPINSQRAICSSLMYRRESEKYLNHEDAVSFAKHALKRLRSAEQKNNFNKLYFQLIRLLLYLLRCRRSNPSCFDPNNKKEIMPFLDAIESMEKARKHLSIRNQTTRTQKAYQILKGFERYLHYEGSEETLVALNKLADDTS